VVKEVIIEGKRGRIGIGDGHPLAVIAGPCVIESERECMEVAAALREICAGLGLSAIFKTSYDKANRTALDSYRGPGQKRGLEIIARVRERVGLPVTSDVHAASEVPAAAEVLDLLQIPAFLCRQTDLLLAAGRSGRPVNIKKGQFMAPRDMEHAAGKVAHTGNENVLLTERGSSFGYNNLIVDMTSLTVMRRTGRPVAFDATHSVQRPGGRGKASGGKREFVPPLARAAAAVGIDALFVEVHPEPERARCDGPNMVALENLTGLLRQVAALDRTRRKECGLRAGAGAEDA